MAMRQQRWFLTRLMLQLLRQRWRQTPLSEDCTDVGPADDVLCNDVSARLGEQLMCLSNIVCRLVVGHVR